MSIKYGIVFPTMLFILFSCSHKNQFPDKLAEKAAVESVTLNRSFLLSSDFAVKDSVQKENADMELNELLIFKKKYDEKDETFNLADFENSWKQVKIQNNNFSFEGIKQWIEITGFLLEITGNASYVQELEEAVYKSPKLYAETEFNEIEKLITPWIFTKDVDHIHVNLFANATIKYEHTLKGAVEITQVTDYPKSGKIQIKFKMGAKRYVELFIRIPDWAEGATVTEKNVKYVATPGSYSQIVRKWSDGDFVEINLPIEQMPK